VSSAGVLLLLLTALVRASHAAPRAASCSSQHEHTHTHADTTTTSELLSDITICSEDGQALRCHKLVLIRWSAPLRRMLTGGACVC
jgi:hypothetical protein